MLQGNIYLIYIFSWHICVNQYRKLHYNFTVGLFIRTAGF